MLAYEKIFLVFGLVFLVAIPLIMTFRHDPKRLRMGRRRASTSGAWFRRRPGLASWLASVHPAHPALRNFPLTSPSSLSRCGNHMVQYTPDRRLLRRPPDVTRRGVLEQLVRLGRLDHGPGAEVRRRRSRA